MNILCKKHLCMEEATPLMSNPLSVKLQAAISNSLPKDKKDIDTILISLLTNSQKKPDISGYWKGHTSFSPQEIQQLLEEKEFAQFFAAYYHDTIIVNADTSHAQYCLRTTSHRIIFPGSVLSKIYTPKGN